MISHDPTESILIWRLPRFIDTHVLLEGAFPRGHNVLGSHSHIAMLRLGVPCDVERLPDGIQMARHEHVRSLEAVLLVIPGQARSVAEKLLRMGNVPGRNQLCSKHMREMGEWDQPMEIQRNSKPKKPKLN